MSHEFRTPMNGILGFTEMLYEDVEEPDQRRILARISSSGHRLMNTLNSILELSDLETNRRDYKLEKIDAAEVVKKAAAEYAEDIKVKGLAFSLEVLQSPLYTYASEALLFETLIKLLDNALKYTDKGEVSLSAFKDETEGESCAKICVRDTGIGIPEEHINLIFEEFRQASEGLSRSYEGAGLGLTLAARMVEMMKGKIDVQSSPGKGSLFTLILTTRLPERDASETIRIDPEKSIAEDEDRIENTVDKHPVILLVEDNDINRDLVKHYLRDKCKVDSAESGNKAIELASKKMYSAVLMDINLGSGMNGLDAAAKIRDLTGYADVPVIAVTGYALNAEKERFLNGVCTHYLAKPFKRRELIEVIDEALQKSIH